MIRHTKRGEAQAVGTLSVAMIEAAFFGLLMATIGLAQLQSAGALAAVVAAINLPSLATRTDEK